MRDIDALSVEVGAGLLGGLLSAVVAAGHYRDHGHYLNALDTDPVAVAARLRVVRGLVYPAGETG